MRYDRGRQSLDRHATYIVATPDGQLLVVDFGHFEMRGERGLEATPGSGKLWKIRLN